MAEARTGRLWSLDAYRGLIMLTLAASGFGLLTYAKGRLNEQPDSVLWRTIKYQTDHPQWLSNVNYVGVSYWDLIQPSFMFMVGVAMPFSYTRRLNRGDSYGRMALHAAVRSVILILLGIFLDSAHRTQTQWHFVNVLTQIGLGYMAVFLLMGRPAWLQLLAFVAILAGYWAWFVGTPVPSAGAWENFAAHFGKNENAAAYVDRWLLNRFPRPELFTGNSGGYTTLNFVPSIATMILGLMCGELLMGERRNRSKLFLLFGGGAVLMGLALALEPVCPIVKRIWTPSWALFSGAYVLWMLGSFYAVIDVLQWRRWAFPLVVLGVNSILLYVMGQLMRPWVASQLKIHFGQSIFSGPYAPIVQATSVMAVFWLLCLWLYRQKLFVRI